MLTQNNLFFEYLMATIARRTKLLYYDSLSFDTIVKLNNKMFFKTFGYNIDWNNLRTFSEKLQYLKLFGMNDTTVLCTDKYLVREYVGRQVGEKYLIPLLGVYEKAADINFDELPQQFVLKTNCSSGDAIIVRNKDLLTKEQIAGYRRFLNYFLHYKFGYRLFELHYNKINPRIIAEQYIDQQDDNLFDYKFHCCNGKCKIVQVIGDRNIEKHIAKEAFYDVKWNRNRNRIYKSYEQYEYDLPCPDNFDEMVSVAESLSSGFSYVRVDLYNIDGRIYFGELTFTPMAGFGKWECEEYDLKAGEMIELNESTF